MLQSPLGDVFHAAVFFFEKLAAEALVVMQTVGGAFQDLFHEVLVAETVEIIDEILDPFIHVVRREDGFKIAAQSRGPLSTMQMRASGASSEQR